MPACRPRPDRSSKRDGHPASSPVSAKLLATCCVIMFRSLFSNRQQRLHALNLSFSCLHSLCDAAEVNSRILVVLLQCPIDHILLEAPAISNELYITKQLFKNSFQQSYSLNLSLWSNSFPTFTVAGHPFLPISLLLPRSLIMQSSHPSCGFPLSFPILSHPLGSF